MTSKDVGRIFAIAGKWLSAGEALAETAKGLLSDRNEERVLQFLHTLVAVVETVGKGLDGDVSVESVETKIQALQDSLAANDAAANVELDERFPQGGP